MVIRLHKDVIYACKYCHKVYAKRQTAVDCEEKCAFLRNDLDYWRDQSDRRNREKKGKEIIKNKINSM